jgi:hypothetical protein
VEKNAGQQPQPHQHKAKHHSPQLVLQVLKRKVWRYVVAVAPDHCCRKNG